MTRGRRFVVLAAAGLLVAVASPAWADPLPNGGFESGNLAGWSAVLPVGGNASVNVTSSNTDPAPRTGVFNWLPTEGNFFVRIKTDGPGNWVQLQRVVSIDPRWNPSMTVTFDWFWDSQDLIINADEARGLVLDAFGNQVAVMFQRSALNDPLNDWGTAWTPTSYVFASAGMYTLVFEITNGFDAFGDSFLGIDNLVAPVPEPLTVLGVLAGLGGVAGYLRRRRAA